MKQHTDINFAFLSNIIPKKWKPYIFLARLDRPVGSWLLFLPCLWSILAASQDFSGKTLYLTTLFGLGALIMRSAGCVINDLWDRDLDKQVERTRMRPLVSGALTTRQALLFLGSLLITGLIILLQLNGLSIILGFCSLFLVVAYPLMKRITYWPQAFLGLTFNWGALMGWTAVTGTFEWPALLIYIGGIFWTLGYDTIYAHQDKEDDLLSGIKSLALTLGYDSHRWIAAFYGCAMAFFILAGYLAGGGILFLFSILPAAGHMAWQIKTWDSDNPQSSLKIFKSNRNFGLLIAFSYALIAL